MNIHRAIAADIAVISPHSLDQILTADWSVWMAGEIAEQTEFSRGEINRLICPGDAQLLEIKHHISEGNGLTSGGFRKLAVSAAQ
jgi:hypothetical protein